MKTTADRIREAREEKGLTQQELAFETGIAIRTISRLETGGSLGTPAIRRAVAKALNKPQKYLWPTNTRKVAS